MIPKQRQGGPAERPSDERPSVLPFTPMVQLEHLLKVAGAVTQDANKVWAEIWAEMKRFTTPGGMVVPDGENGFVPSCGWPEFLEKFWLLKHYLDSVQRICSKEH